MNTDVPAPVTDQQVFWYTVKSVGLALVFGLWMYELGKSKGSRRVK